MPRPSDALARACGWACAWGFVIGLPPAALVASMPRAAAAAVVVWLLAAAAAGADASDRPTAGDPTRPSGLPGGTAALVAAGLAVAAVLGPGAAAAAAVGTGSYLVGRRRLPWVAFRLGLPTTAAAVGAWSVVAGSADRDARGLSGLSALAAADLGIVAVLLACAAVAVAFARDDAPRRVTAARWGAALALVVALAAAGRPGGLWLAAAACAGAWPLRITYPATGARGSAHLIPGLLAAVAGIDRLLG